jgi:serine/threonine protein kinase
MCGVYRAKDTRLDRIVAINVLPAHLSSDPDLKQRLEREAKAISALQHANICYGLRISSYRLDPERNLHSMTRNSVNRRWGLPTATSDPFALTGHGEKSSV